MKPFVALDGESYRDEYGDDLYNLIQASDGSHIRNDCGLSTLECIDYLLGLKSRNPDAIFVGFGFSLDVNYFIRSLPSSAKERLARLEWCVVWGKAPSSHCYRFEYIPGKKFIMSRGKGEFKDDPKKPNGKTLSFKANPGESITIYDTWGFFQKSFLAAIKEFRVATPEELLFIAYMKEKRSKFTLADYDEIFRYNALECDLLVRLMDRVRDRFESIGLNLKSWHGAGAVGGTLLRREKVNEHIVAPKIEAFHEATLHAYFGGRIQCCQNGLFKEVYTYDIVSAYPAVTAELPSLIGMRESITYAYDPDYPLAIYEISWDIPRDSAITPFPFRSPSGSIDYTFKGRGMYWQVEIAAALEYFGDYITIHKGWRFDGIDLDSRAFAFVPDMFEKRKVLKANDDMAQVCIKLALNSLYGKTVQAVGGRAGKKPPFQSYIYGGLITAGTRAKMLHAAMQAPENVVAFATDGICSRSPLDLRVGTSLGDWEETAYPEAFILKSGVYRYFGEKGGSKTRGINPEAVNWDIMREIWETKGLDGKYKTPKDKSKQFIGMKSASDKRPHCTWQESPRTISFYQPRYEHVWLGDSPLQYRLVPPTEIPGISARYVKHGQPEPGDDYNPDLEYRPELD